jgi:hypothetical protein
MRKRRQVQLDALETELGDLREENSTLINRLAELTKVNAPDRANTSGLQRAGCATPSLLSAGHASMILG